MSQQIPFAIDAEYRGRQAEGGDFVNNAGEKVTYGPAYKFEYDLPDGEPVVMALREGQVDKCFDGDAAQLKKGELVSIVGVAIMADRGSEGSSFVRLFTLRRRSAVALKAAS
jgi:hypothetical protein